MVGPRRQAGRGRPLRPRDGGLPGDVPSLAGDPQARYRDGAGRLHRRRPHARLGVRPDRRRRRRLLRRPGGADGDTWRGVLRPPVGARAAFRQGGPVHGRAVRRPARLPARHGEPGGAARRTGRSDLRAGGRDRHDATVRPGSREACRQPVRGPDGNAAGHGRGVRPASPRTRAQRRGIGRPARGPGRSRDEGQCRRTQCRRTQCRRTQCRRTQCRRTQCRRTRSGEHSAGEHSAGEHREAGE